jgi:anaerobic C4-dicarboxylate transporter DcuB
MQGRNDRDLRGVRCGLDGGYVLSAHLGALQSSLAGVVQQQPWTYALVLFVVSKLVNNSQAAALVAVAPIGLALGVEPAMIILLRVLHPADLSVRPGLHRLRPQRHHEDRDVINHSFFIPGLISVFTSCAVGYALVTVFL